MLFRSSTIAVALASAITMLSSIGGRMMWWGGGRSRDEMCIRDRGDLADAIGVTRQTIGLIEAGKYNPTLSLCLAICKTLDKTLDQLFWE